MNILSTFTLTRRDFLKVSGSVAVMTQIQPARAQQWLAQVGKTGSKPDMVGQDAKIIRSVCLMCHSGCGIQCTIQNGELVKIDGNPYHPNNYDYVSKGDIVEESDLDGGLNGKDVGTLCAKGQAGIYALYSPARLKHPLKRVGPRGSGKWKTISWEQALKEITEGGLLFKNVPGEESRMIEGLKSVLNNDKPMGPEDSDFMDEAPPEGWGPKRNQFVWAHGRNEQSPLTPRFVKDSAGTPNMLNHCDRCAGTFYNVVEHVMNVPPYEIGAYADYEYTTFLISVGSNITHADYPGQTKARYLQKLAKRTGPDAKQFKHVVVDPWLSPRRGQGAAVGQGRVDSAEAVHRRLLPARHAALDDRQQGLQGRLPGAAERTIGEEDRPAQLERHDVPGPYEGAQALSLRQGCGTGPVRLRGAGQWQADAVPRGRRAGRPRCRGQTERRQVQDRLPHVARTGPGENHRGMREVLRHSGRHDRAPGQGVYGGQASRHRDVPRPDPAVQRLVERPGADHPQHDDGQHRSQGWLHPRPQGVQRIGGRTQA